VTHICLAELFQKTCLQIHKFFLLLDLVGQWSSQLYFNLLLNFSFRTWIVLLNYLSEFSYILLSFLLLFLNFKSGSHYVAQAGLKPPIFLPQTPECWDYIYVLLRLAWIFIRSLFLIQFQAFHIFFYIWVLLLENFFILSEVLCLVSLSWYLCIL
jgi:hypothetical protein